MFGVALSPGLHVSPEFVALSLVAVVAALERYTTLLDKFKRKSASDAAGELEIADRKLRRIQNELDEMRVQKVRLEQESLSPILELLKAHAELQKQVLDRLTHHNGSFAHMEETMGHVADGMKALIGTIADLHEIPLRKVTSPSPRRKTT